MHTLINARTNPFCQYTLLLVILNVFLAILSVKGNNIVLSENQEWSEFKHAEGAFSVKFPGKPEYSKIEVPNPSDSTGPGYQMHLFIAQDEINKTQYLIRYNDFPPGMFLEDKARLFDLSVKDLGKKGDIFYGPEAVKVGNYDGVEVRMMMSNRYTICRIFVRGNRTYLLFKQNMLEKIRVSLPDDFFSSFTFQPFQAPALTSFKPDDENFKIKIFGDPRFISGDVDAPDNFFEKYSGYTATNPNSGGVYLFEQYIFRKYYRIKNIDSVYKALQKTLSTDSVISEKEMVVDGIKAREFSTMGKQTYNITRSRFWIDEGKMFYLKTYSVDEEAFSSYSDLFFDSFVRLKKSQPVDLSKSRAQQVIDDASSSDTTLRKNALGAFNYYHFSEDELPIIYAALERNFPDDTTSSGIRMQLLEGLIELNNPGSIHQLKQLYSSPKSTSILKENILYAIASIKSDSSHSTYFDLLTKHPLLGKKSLNWKTFAALRDSLPFAATNFDKLKPLFTDAAYRSDILNLSGTLVNSSDSSHKKLVLRNREFLMKYALEDETLYLADEEKSNVDIWTYLNLMEEFPGSVITDQFTDKLVKSKPEGWSSTRAATIRIRKGLKIDDAFLRIKLDSMYSRYAIMHALFDTKKLNIVPKTFMESEQFAKLCMYEFITEDEDTPEKIELLGKIIEKDSLHYVFNIYTLGEEDTLVQYIGISGPHKAGHTELYFDKYKAYTNWAIKEDDWEEQAKKIIAEQKEYE